MKKKGMILFVVLVLTMFLAAHALAEGRPLTGAAGNGGTFTELPNDTTWVEMMRVGPVTIKNEPGTCVVSASYIVGTFDPGDMAYITIGTTSAAQGPWVQAYEGDVGFISGAMVQAFDVPADTPSTFYVNGRMVWGGPLTTENTRVFVICFRNDGLPSPVGPAGTVEGVVNSGE